MRLLNETVGQGRLLCKGTSGWYSQVEWINCDNVSALNILQNVNKQGLDA